MILYVSFEFTTKLTHENRIFSNGNIIQLFTSKENDCEHTSCSIKRSGIYTSRKSTLPQACWKVFQAVWARTAGFLHENKALSWSKKQRFVIKEKVTAQFLRSSKWLQYCTQPSRTLKWAWQVLFLVVWEPTASPFCERKRSQMSQKLRVLRLLYLQK